jgi:hypothetical protein
LVLQSKSIVEKKVEVKRDSIRKRTHSPFLFLSVKKASGVELKCDFGYSNRGKMA